MAVVALDRRFIEFEYGLDDPDTRRPIGLDHGSVGWDDLLAERRVIILAEAGSGKSTELAERKRILTANGQYAFYATVHDVGWDGLEGALDFNGRQKLAAWIKSSDEAWFLIDSVDEAKSKGTNFERVLRKVADGIRGAEERAHIFVSTRITDWEFHKDFKCFRTALPISSPITKRALTPEEELLTIVRRERREEKESTRPPLDGPSVVRMAPLDRDQVRRFARAKAAPNLDAFLEAVHNADLWRFASRPLDLDWLVQFWKSERRLGSLSEMVELSITERLKETNSDRVRSDTLNSVQALRAVERVGAAMVLCKRTTLKISDGEVAFTPDLPLDLADVLPDWSSENRLLLLARPIFDPATLGRVRFHNDNDGVVRGFLTAKWLVRLREDNLSTKAVFDLLFEKSYTLEVIKPSLSETAAWLSLWDSDVANEVMRRNPGLLLSAGDPASLTCKVRRNALKSLLDQIINDDLELSLWNDDKLRRFAQPDLGSVVADLWPQYQANNDAVKLLMRIVRLGHLRNCAKLACDAACNAALDASSRVAAGKALLVTGDGATLAKYAKTILAGLGLLPSTMISDAMVALFPSLISVSELLNILNTLDFSKSEGGRAFEWQGPRLVEKLIVASEIESLLTGLLAQFGGEVGEYADGLLSEREEAYLPLIAAAALRLLQASPHDDAPDISIDATLLICNLWRHRTDSRAKVKFLLEELHRTSSRRRRAFWRVVEVLRRNSQRSSSIDRLWHINKFGYSSGLGIEDVTWLLSDCLPRGEYDCRLGIDAALTIYREFGEPLWLLGDIASATKANAVASEAYRELTEMRQASAEELEIGLEAEEIESRYFLEQAECDQSWIKFIRDLQADPQRIRDLTTPPLSGCNLDLFDLWRLLVGPDVTLHYAIASVAPLERIAGNEIAEAVRAGLIAHWRNSAPRLRSERDAKERHLTRQIDLMGLAGVSLEATTVENWAKHLSSLEATRAVGYATLEFNGYPLWLSGLAAVRPVEVAAVLMGEIVDEITRAEISHPFTLQTLAFADIDLAAILALQLLEYLEQKAQLPLEILSFMLRLLVRGLSDAHTLRFQELGVERFRKELNPRVAGQYFAAIFAFDPQMATTALTEKVSLLSHCEQVELVDRCLSACFGDSTSTIDFRPANIRSETLEELVRLSFQSQSQIALQRRQPGVAYRLDENDHAIQARSSVFNCLTKTPGAATYYALLRFQSNPTCPIPPRKLRSFAKERAIQDSDIVSWQSSDVIAFENKHEPIPRTPKDLQSLILRRIEEMQHDLVHGDFAQGSTLKAFSSEGAVQNWVADRLRSKQGRSFSVEREPHVADEKEPDIRVRGKANDASVAIEIKVAESWTLKDLDDALETQLCGRYLRASDGQHGILLLVHQKGRAKGWEDRSNASYLPISEVIARLSARAAEIAGTDSFSPQPQVAVLDVATLLSVDQHTP